MLAHKSWWDQTGGPLVLELTGYSPSSRTFEAGTETDRGGVLSAGLLSFLSYTTHPQWDRPYISTTNQETDHRLAHRPTKAAIPRWGFPFLGSSNCVKLKHLSAPEDHCKPVYTREGGRQAGRLHERLSLKNQVDRTGLHTPTMHTGHLNSLTYALLHIHTEGSDYGIYFSMLTS